MCCLAGLSVLYLLVPVTLCGTDLPLPSTSVLLLFLLFYLVKWNFLCGKTWKYSADSLPLIPCLKFCQFCLDLSLAAEITFLRLWQKTLKFFSTFDKVISPTFPCLCSCIRSYLYYILVVHYVLLKHSCTSLSWALVSTWLYELLCLHQSVMFEEVFLSCSCKRLLP